MKKYVELTLLPDVDISLYFLWEKLYQQLHLAFVEYKKAHGIINVGVSFPRYNKSKRSLGNKLRIFAPSSEDLEALNLHQWLNRLSDYVHITRIRDVPDTVSGYAFFRRLSDKTGLEKLARRRAAKLGFSYAEALRFFREKKDRQLPKHDASRYPFISLRSLSSEHKYPVTVIREKADALVLSASGFSTYGLSSSSSVPLFP